MDLRLLWRTHLMPGGEQVSIGTPRRTGRLFMVGYEAQGIDAKCPCDSSQHIETAVAISPQNPAHSALRQTGALRELDLCIQVKPLGHQPGEVFSEDVLEVVHA